MTRALLTQRRIQHPMARRRGVIVLTLLAAFAATLVFCGAWAREIVRTQRCQRLAEQRVQAAWLAEAGLRRAAAQVVADREYTGEAWRLEASRLSRPQPALVVIRVATVEGRRRVRIVAKASYPANSPRVQETKTVVFNPTRESET